MKKSAASVGSSVFSSPSVRSPITARSTMSQSSTLLSRPVVATKALSSAFHTTSSTPLLWPVHSATGQEVLLRRSHSFSTGVASESSTTGQSGERRAPVSSCRPSCGCHATLATRLVLLSKSSHHIAFWRMSQTMTWPDAVLVQTM